MKKHTHKFIRTKTTVPLYTYKYEEGKPAISYISGRDVLKQFKCVCGVVKTVDLERVAG